MGAGGKRGNGGLAHVRTWPKSPWLGTRASRKGAVVPDGVGVANGSKRLSGASAD